VARCVAAGVGEQKGEREERQGATVTYDLVCCPRPKKGGGISRVISTISREGGGERGGKGNRPCPLLAVGGKGEGRGREHRCG